jgi:hypothetical protein
MIEISKSQTIRLIDVFWIGPLMVYAGSQKKFSPLVNSSLIVFGIATILYNGKNYLLNREIQSEQKFSKSIDLKRTP